MYKLKVFCFIHVQQKYLFNLNEIPTGDWRANQCFLLQTSIWLEMLEALKFAINPFAGDTKENPLACESQVNSRASSKAMLSKSTAESLNKYGQIGDELSLSKAVKDPTYERFNDQS